MNDKPKTYKTDVQYESVRRRRNKKMLDAILQSTKTVPKPDWRRWNSAMERILAAMTQIESEMVAYHDQRTTRWRKGRNAYVLIERMQELREAKDAVAAWLEYERPDCSSSDFVTLREWKEQQGQ